MVARAVAKRLRKPELLFLLRNVDPSELVGTNAARAMVAKASGRKGRVLEGEDLTEVFGIDVKDGERRAARFPGRRKRAAQ